MSSVDALPNMGGISIMAHHLANSFVDLGHEVTFIGPKGTHVPPEYSRRYDLLEDWNSQVQHRSGEAGAVEDRRICELFSQVIAERHVDRVLLLHPFYYGIGALDAAERTGIPTSVYFHGYELRSQLKGSYPSNHLALVRQRRIGTLRERVFYLVATASELLVNSSYTASLLDGFTIKPEVRVTGCGLPVDVIDRELALTPKPNAEQKRQLRLDLGLPQATCIAYVGRLVPTKGVEHILRACSESPDLSALIVGDGPDRGRLESLARELRVQDRVTLLGGVSEESKWRYLRAADFLALLSCPDDERGQVEGFGIALLEGAAAGCVPLTSGSGGMRDVVQDWRTGLVSAVGAPPDAAALRFVASRQGLREALVGGAREQLKSKYNWEAVARGITSQW